MRGNYIKWIGGNQEKAKEIRVREKGEGPYALSWVYFFGVFVDGRGCEPRSLSMFLDL